MKYINYFFYLTIFLALTATVINLSSYREYQVVVHANHSATDISKDKHGQLYRLPFSLSLNHTDRETYPSGQLKMLSANISVDYNGGSEIAEISINKPHFFHQYGVYLNFMKKADSGAEYVELLVTESKANKFVYVSLLLVVLSSIAMVFRYSTSWLSKGRFAVFALFMLAVVAVFLFFNPLLRSHEVPPILRSVWFLPHVIAYVVSYALMFLAWLLSIISLSNKEKYIQASKSLYACGLSFYTVGLAVGMIWANYAWGTYWGWDVKENLALLAFSVYALLFPLMENTKSKWLNFILHTVSILLLLLCWFGPRIFHWGGIHV